MNTVVSASSVGEEYNRKTTVYLISKKLSKLNFSRRYSRGFIEYMDLIALFSNTNMYSFNISSFAPQQNTITLNTVGVGIIN